MTPKVYRIQKKEPLGKWETVTVAAMTFEQAATKCYDLLSPAVSELGSGTAHKTRFAELWANNWTHIPTLLD